MFSSEASCSDCKIEFIRKKWSKLLLNWINRCIHEKGKGKRERRLTVKLLSDIMSKYRYDVCEDDIDRAMLCQDDMEPFIMYKYPMLKLSKCKLINHKCLLRNSYFHGKRHIEDQDIPKKLFIMTSILLYHCCVKSRSGVVHDHIYHHLKKYEQELVLKFCERLSDMEITISNVEVAIQEAFECVIKQHEKPSPDPSLSVLEGKKSSDTAAQMSVTSTLKSSIASLPSDGTGVMDESSVTVQAKIAPVKLTSEVKFLSPIISEQPKPSEIVTVAKATTAQQCVSADFKPIEDPDRFKWKKESKKEINLQKDEIEKSKVILEINKQVEVNTMVSKRFDKKDVETSKLTQKTAFVEQITHVNRDLREKEQLQSECSCTRCNATGPCCGDSANIAKECECNDSGRKSSLSEHYKFFRERLQINRKITALIIAIALFFTLAAISSAVVPFIKVQKSQPKAFSNTVRLIEKRQARQGGWECANNLCQKVLRTTNTKTFLSHSRCILVCTGPVIWPQPIGHTEFAPKIIALAINKLEYKLKTVSSENLQRHLAEAFKLFIGDLAKLEKAGQNYKTKTLDLDVIKMNIKIEIESDPDPRMRLNTEESYQLNLQTLNNQVNIMITSSSFCGVRHGLETLTQMILLDESTGHLITVANASVKDAPSYKYRGLMIDTGRNYIPVEDLMRTIDIMATVKLNTFHWRISDVTSFPLYLPKVPQLFKYGAYDRSMIYTKDDVKTVVKRAGVRGVRVLIEVAFPGPVGRPWSWSSGKSCPSKNNGTCDNVLCTVLEPQDSVLDVLQDVYEEILEMTQVDDIFHLSHGVFSLANCYNLLKNRDGFLDKALDSLKRANKGFLPKLPIIWYTSLLNKDFESKSWERFGVQLNEWRSNPTEKYLAKFKVIHSSKWDLSCEIKNHRCKRYRSWQEMYSWKSWRNLPAFTVEGGEAILWTDLVDSGNLDYHLWPRTAAVAERLWSDIIINATANGMVYVRLNHHRSRMLHAGVKSQAIWPAWCTYNPGVCLKKIQA